VLFRDGAASPTDWLKKKKKRLTAQVHASHISLRYQLCLLKERFGVQNSELSLIVHEGIWNYGYLNIYLFVCIDTEFLDEQVSKLHVLMVTLSVESKEMSCANLSWLVLILGATAAWFALTCSVHKKMTSSADLQCSLELFASYLVWHTAHWNLYSAVEDRICSYTSTLGGNTDSSA